MPDSEEIPMRNVSGKQYLSFLLRLSRSEQQSGWRATLHDPLTGEQIAFPTITKLFSFLRQKTATEPKELEE